MALSTEERQKVTYFIGTEVEHTAMQGTKTLFVVGAQPWKEIKKRADKHKIKHIYFGTSQSFQPKNYEESDEWFRQIVMLLREGYWCTLDFGVEHIDTVHDMRLYEHSNFIAMISVKLPGIEKLNYNTVKKIDYKTWGHRNPGVWTHCLSELTRRKDFTGWEEYPEDTKID